MAVGGGRGSGSSFWRGVLLHGVHCGLGACSTKAVLGLAALSQQALLDKASITEHVCGDFHSVAIFVRPAFVVLPLPASSCRVRASPPVELELLQLDLELKLLQVVRCFLYMCWGPVKIYRRYVHPGTHLMMHFCCVLFSLLPYVDAVPLPTACFCWVGIRDKARRVCTPGGCSCAVCTHQTPFYHIYSDMRMPTSKQARASPHSCCPFPTLCCMAQRFGQDSRLVTIFLSIASQPVHHDTAHIISGQSCGVAAVQLDRKQGR